MQRLLMRHRRLLAGVSILLIAPLAQANGNLPAARGVPDTLQQRIVACTTCHGEHGEGEPGSRFFPRLAGKPAVYLERQLLDFQRGLRNYAPMEYTVRGLDPAYLRKIADYFAAQQVPYAKSAVPALPAAALQRGAQLATKGDATRGIPACQSCHGKALTGVVSGVPGLVGLPYDYLSAQLGAWRTHTRASTAPDCMVKVVGRLSETDITAVAAWLASREPPLDAQLQPADSIDPPLRCGVLQEAVAR